MVSDVFEARAFLEKYFGITEVGKNHRKMTHVQDESGFILSLFHGTPITAPETTHIGFIQENEAQVNAVYERLKADGFDQTRERFTVSEEGWTANANAWAPPGPSEPQITYHAGEDIAHWIAQHFGTLTAG